MKHFSQMTTPRRQRGISLVIVLVLLFATLFLGASAAVIALQAEKASRGDRDRQIAFEAAEAALNDASLDIEGSVAGAVGGRVFASDSAIGFPALDGSVTCYTAQDAASFGLCRSPVAGQPESWLSADFSIENINAESVEYGHFTNSSFATGSGNLPSKLPRYLIELMPDNQAGNSAQAVKFFYRITAIGFGAHPETRVVLQIFHRKV